MDIDKREALAVLQEIAKSCKKGWIITCISLECPSSQISKDSTSNYQIRLKCKLDEKSTSCLKSITEKHDLELLEENGYVNLFTKQK